MNSFSVESFLSVLRYSSLGTYIDLFYLFNSSVNVLPELDKCKILPVLTDTRTLPFHCLQEIFGPIVTVYVYPDEKYRETALIASETSPFALTCAVYAEDE